MSKLLRCCFLTALCALASVSAVKAGTIYWVDWQTTVNEGGLTKYVGTITVTRPDLTTFAVKVKYTPPGGIAFFQTGGGTDFWAQGPSGSLGRNPARSPYTSSVVSNIPTGTDIVGLQFKGTNTLEFTDSTGAPIQIASPIFAYVSLNGNGYGFDQDFDILSYGDPATGKDIGWWGTGTSSKNVVVVGGATQYQLLGTGEPHGALQFRGVFAKVKWESLSNEFWNGFTIGVPGLAVDVPIANAGADQTVMAGNDCNGVVQLSGSVSGSTNAPFTYAWSGSFGTATGPTPVVSLPAGTHTITLTVTDAHGSTGTDTVVVTVVRGTTFSQPVPDAFPGTDFMTCIMGNFQEPTRLQNWKIRLRSSALETVVLRVAATTVNTAEAGSMVATVTDETGLRTLTVVHPPTQSDNLGTIALQLQGGKIYDLAIQRTGQAAHYKLGAPDKRLEIGFSSPILYLEHSEQAWVVNAAPNEDVNITVHKDTPPIGGAAPQADSITYSVRRADCSVVVPTTTMAVSGTIAFNAGPTGGAFVIYMDPEGHFTLLKNSGCDVGFYALPCAPHVQIGCPPNVVKPNDPGRCGALVNFAASATGACVGPVSYSIPPGSFFPIGTTPVVASVTDMYGETASCTFAVTVNDFEAPVIACPAAITVGTDPGQCTASVPFAVTATDNCGAANLAYSIPPGSSFPIGTTTVGVTATDASGNKSKCTFTVTVTDKEPPKIQCPADITVGNDPGKCGAVVTFAVSAADNCGSATVSYSTAPGSSFPIGTTTVTATATDAAGNTTSCAFKVTVNDTEAPKLACPANLTVGNDAGKCSAVVNFAATATDNCTGAVTIAYSIAPGAVFQKGTTPVTVTATDAAGNKASCTFTVTVNDTEAPTGYCVETNNPSGNNVPKAGANPKSGQNPDGFYQLSGKDNCDAPSALGLYIKDSASSFIAGPFTHGDKVKITQAPGVTPNSKPMAGDIVAHIQLKGDALVVAVDTSGNTSVVGSCLVAPLPK